MEDDIARRSARVLGRALALVVGCLVIVELVVRLSGMADFPIYDVGPPTEYIMAPNQSGRFLDVNDWYFNNKSMPVKRDWAVVHPNVLLIGNSIVMGGNPFRQAQKLVSQVQGRLGPSQVVWPVAMGGWTQPNEVAYLGVHPEIVASTDYVAWEYMAGGLSRPTPWPGPYVFPAHRPLYATPVVFRRYILPLFIQFPGPTALPLTGALRDANLQRFNAMAAAIARSARCAPAGFVWLYPTVGELSKARGGADWLPERSEIVSGAQANGLHVIDIAQEPMWNASLYRSDGVHPTVQGTAVLGAILARVIAADAVLRQDCGRARAS